MFLRIDDGNVFVCVCVAMSDELVSYRSATEIAAFSSSSLPTSASLSVWCWSVDSLGVHLAHNHSIYIWILCATNNSNRLLSYQSKSIFIHCKVRPLLHFVSEIGPERKMAKCFHWFAIETVHSASMILDSVYWASERLPHHLQLSTRITYTAHPVGNRRSDQMCTAERGFVESVNIVFAVKMLFYSMVKRELDWNWQKK